MSKLNWVAKSCGIFLLWVAAAVALPAQTFTSYSFGSGGGEYPYAGLVQGTSGMFYGTTEYGGAVDDFGTVFSLSVGLKPFVKTQPTPGPVGGTVKILETNLTGATTGKVQVSGPGSTGVSNVPFIVRP